MKIAEVLGIGLIGVGIYYAFAKSHKEEKKPSSEIVVMRTFNKPPEIHQTKKPTHVTYNINLPKPNFPSVAKKVKEKSSVSSDIVNYVNAYKNVGALQKHIEAIQTIEPDPESMKKHIETEAKLKMSIGMPISVFEQINSKKRVRMPDLLDLNRRKPINPFGGDISWIY